jgi:hypothetical protein
LCCFFSDLFGLCVVSLVKEETTHNPNKWRKKQHTIQTSPRRNNTKAKQIK